MTEGIRPGVVACSHHMGRWRTENAKPGESGIDRWASAEVRLTESPDGDVAGEETLRAPGRSRVTDPDSSRVWWGDVGRAPEPHVPGAPRSGERPALLAPAGEASRRPRHLAEGDIFVDRNRAEAVYREWLAMARPARGEWRRPLWLHRPYRPTLAAFRREPEAAD